MQEFGGESGGGVLDPPAALGIARQGGKLAGAAQTEAAGGEKLAFGMRKAVAQGEGVDAAPVVVAAGVAGWVAGEGEAQRAAADVERGLVAPAVQASDEFTTTCPRSAACMQLFL